MCIRADIQSMPFQTSFCWWENGMTRVLEGLLGWFREKGISLGCIKELKQIFDVENHLKEHKLEDNFFSRKY